MTEVLQVVLRATHCSKISHRKVVGAKTFSMAFFPQINSFSSVFCTVIKITNLFLG